MYKRTYRFGLFTLCGALGLTGLCCNNGGSSLVAPPAGSPALKEDNSAALKKATEVVGRLPLYFEANKGQTRVPGVDFISHGNGFTVYLTSNGPIMALREVISSHEQRRRAKENRRKGLDHYAPTNDHAMIGMQLLGAQHGVAAEALEPLPGKTNYYAGSDPSKWVAGVPTFGRVRYQGVYPGIDVVYYGNQRHLEYDFVVAPGGDPNQIRISLQGMERASVDAAGNLVLTAGKRSMMQHRPVVYQEVNGVKTPVSGEYALKGDEATFKLGAYDHTQKLVIDPVFKFGSFLGGDGEDKGHGIAVDSLGNIYISGSSQTLDVTIKRQTDPQSPLPCPYNLAGATCTDGVPFPVVNYWKEPLAAGTGNAQQIDAGNKCCMGSNAGPSFIAKLNPAGDTLLYASYLGGFAGYRDQLAGPPWHHVHAPCPPDLDALGVCEGSDSWAKGWSEAFTIDVDSTGRAYIGGHAEDMDFPTTADALKTNHAGPYNDGTLHSPPVEATISPGRVGPLDSPMYAYLAIFKTDGSLQYSTLIGNHSDGTKTNYVSVVDSGLYQGIWIVGEVTSTSFFTCTTDTGCPDTGPVDIALNPDGLGGMPAVNSYQIQLDQAPCDNSSAARTTYWGASVPYPGGGPDMVGCVKPIPATAGVECHDAATDALQDGTNGRGMMCWDNAFLFRLTLDGKKVIWSTFFGGTGDGAGYTLRPDPATGIAYYAGDSEASDHPTTKGAVQTCMGGNGTYPGDFLAPATDSINAPNAGKGFPLAWTGYTPQLPITAHLATAADVTPGSIFPCNLSPSPQTWDFEVEPPTQKWKPGGNGTMAKFGPTGALLYASYIGGTGDSSAGAPASNFTGGLGATLDFDRTGMMYVSGWTESELPYCGTPAGSSALTALGCDPFLNDPRRTAFPYTAGAFQTFLPHDPTDACTAGSPPDCVEPNKRVHGVGFVAKIDPSKNYAAGGWDGTTPVIPGTGYVWSTYIGGYGDTEFYSLRAEKGPGTGCPAAPAACNPAVYVHGVSDTWNFPICGNGMGPAISVNCQQGPLDTIEAGSAAMTGPYQGRFLNGVPPDFVAFPPVAATGYPGGYDSTNPPQSSDAVLVKVKADGSGLIYSTYLGGRSDEEGHTLVYVNNPTFRGVYVTGLTNSDGLGYCGQGTPAQPSLTSGTVPPPVTWTCIDPDTNIQPGNPFPTSTGAFQEKHSVSRIVLNDGAYPWAIDCLGPSHPSYLGVLPDCRGTNHPQAPNEDAFIVKISD